MENLIYDDQFLTKLIDTIRNYPELFFKAYDLKTKVQYLPHGKNWPVYPTQCFDNAEDWIPKEKFLCVLEYILKMPLGTLQTYDTNDIIDYLITK